MPELRELLAATARDATAGPDLEALEVRAAALRRRDRLVKVAAVGVAGLLAVPLVRWGGGGKQVLEQVPATGSTATPSVTASPRAPAPGGVPSSRPGATATAAGRPLSRGPVPTAPAGPSSRPSPSVPTRSLPPGTGCEVTTVNLAPGGTRSCQFTATRAAGARATWTGHPGVFAGYDAAAYADVVRDGQRQRYDLYHDDSCLEDVIQPGDQVTLTVEQFETGYEEFTLKAGPDISC